eukprot:CAMPEP_0113594944 /NCGR_PEP_ID=MMETSP0015_2-20120614/39372_1 /TAXON_ID=2838 /ORGANISM="Odontella" /LENGTH=56 /DNA_ID=CAMNT_0000502025 /DNA_START=1410 /DNA_END=1581 /DNA_ORIENTATION=+ /assembly_acc=CAM_ASM_000160
MAGQSDGIQEAVPEAFPSDENATLLKVEDEDVNEEEPSSGTGAKVICHLKCAAPSG